MTSKLVLVDIVRTRSRFDAESPHWLGMSIDKDVKKIRTARIYE